MHHHERKHGQQNDHDRQHAHERKETDARSDLLFHHLPQSFPAAPDRCEQHNHIVHGAAERGADQNPKCARQKSKLRGEHRPNQWPRSGDRCEMMTEHHPAIGRDKVFPIIPNDSRRRPFIVQDQHLGRQPFAVETIADRRRTQTRDDDPKRAHLFPA